MEKPSTHNFGEYRLMAKWLFRGINPLKQCYISYRISLKKSRPTEAGKPVNPLQLREALNHVRD